MDIIGGMGGEGGRGEGKKGEKAEETERLYGDMRVQCVAGHVKTFNWQNLDSSTLSYRTATMKLSFSPEQCKRIVGNII